MKFVASQHDLVEALTIISPVTVDKGSQLPVLTNTLISSIGDNTIRFVATDSMIFSSVCIDSEVVQNGSVCMCAKDLLDRIRKMPSESNLTIDSDGNIGCNSSSRKHHIPVLNPELFPLVQMPNYNELSVNVPSSKLRELINRTWFAVSNDYTQPNIHNSYLVFNGSNIQMISFDGYKLAFAEQEYTEKYETVPVPYKAVMFIKRWLSKIGKDDEVRITKNIHGIYFTIEDAVYGFREIAASPPDYQKIFSLEYANIAILERDELIDSVVSNMLTDDKVIFTFDTTKNKCKISCRGEEGKHTEDQIDCRIKGNPPKFKINGKFLLDSINSFSSTKVRFKLGKTKSDPIMITEPGYKTIIAPMVD